MKKHLPFALLLTLTLAAGLCLDVRGGSKQLTIAQNPPAPCSRNKARRGQRRNYGRPDSRPGMLENSPGHSWFCNSAENPRRISRF
jgi:hypothetical protein